MVLNNDCVRALLIWLEDNQKLKSNGLFEQVHLRSAYSALAHFSQDDLNLSARYLVEKNLVTLANNRKANEVSPKHYVFSSISASGYDYLAAVRDDTVWKKIKDKLGSAVLASVPTVIELAAKLLSQSPQI